MDDSQKRASVVAFEILDRHVVHGRGEATACTDASGSLTFARLLERSAALAGGLAVFGIKPGDPFEIDLPAGNARVMAVCAVIRLGMVPGSAARVWFGLTDDVPTVRVREPEHEHCHEVSLVERAGRSEPAPALIADPPGYADLVHDVFPDIVGPLRTGSPVV